MTCKIAAYDTALRRAEADYWAWSHEALSDEARRQILYGIMPNKPDDLGGSGSETIIGGIKSLNDHECVAYRFVDGGRDAGGRPGRLVILVAVTPIDELARHDPLMPLRWLTPLASAAMTGELARPDKLEFNASGSPARVTVDTRRLCHDKTEVNLESVGQAAEAFGLVAARQKQYPFDLVIDDRAGSQPATLRVNEALHFSYDDRGIEPPAPSFDGHPTTEPVQRRHEDELTSAKRIQDSRPDADDESIATRRTRMWLQLSALFLVGGMIGVAALVWIIDSIGGGDPAGAAPQSEPLDPRQAILAYVHYYQVTHHGRGPTTQDIAVHLFPKDEAAAKRLLEELERTGKIARPGPFVSWWHPGWQLKLRPEEIRALPQLMR